MQEFNRGDVVYIDFSKLYNGEYKGLQNGNRPCIIVSNDACNKYSPCITVIPLTSRNKKDMPTHTKVWVFNNWSTALCETIVTIPKEIADTTDWHISHEAMFNVENCIRNQVLV